MNIGSDRIGLFGSDAGFFLAVGVACALCVATLLGWLFDMPILRSGIHGAVEMKANAAIALLLSCSALVVLGRHHAPASRYKAFGLSFLAGLIGFASLAEYALGIHLGIDEFLVRDTAVAYNLDRGRMSPYTAVALIGLAAGMVANARAKTRSVAWLICGGVFAIGAASVLGYAWSAHELTTDGLVPPVAINTALTLMLLAAATLTVRSDAARPGRDPLRLLSVEGQVLMGLGVALLLMFVGGSYTYQATVRFDTAMTEVSKIQEIRTTLARMYAQFSDAESAQRHYLLTGDARQRDMYRSYVAKVGGFHDALSSLMAEDVAQTENLAHLWAAMTRRFASFEVEVREYDDASLDSHATLLAQDLADPARAMTLTLLGQMDAVEAALAKRLQEQATQVRQFTLAALLLTLGLASTLGVMLFRAVRREMRVREEGRRFDARGQRALSLFTSTLSRERAIQGTLDLLGEFDVGAGAAFYAYSIGAEHMHRAAISGEIKDLPVTTSASVGPVAEAALHQQLMISPETESADAEWRFPARAAPYLLACPVIYRGRTLGVLAIATPRPLRSHERAFVSRMGGQLGVALNNLKQYSDLLDLSGQLSAKNEALREQAAELEKGNRMKSEFLANMSHELRTPLNAILGFAEVLHDNLAGEMSEQQREYVGDILGGGQHLLELINDILDLSKIEAGKMELRLGPAAIRPWVDNALTMVRERALSHQVTLRLEIDAPLPQLCLDARRVKQILFNLLGNAVKFTGDGGTVVLRAGYVSSHVGGSLELSVRDNGIGISPEDQARLFQPFVQIDSSLTKKFEGTGLGLAMVKRLALLHGGAVSVTSEPGQGSTFAVTIPCRVVDDGALHDATPARQEAAPKQHALALTVERNSASAPKKSRFRASRNYHQARLRGPIRGRSS